MGDQIKCICDQLHLFDPPRPTPVAVEGCPAHVARRAAQESTLHHAWWTTIRDALSSEYMRRVEQKIVASPEVHIDALTDAIVAAIFPARGPSDTSK